MRSEEIREGRGRQRYRGREGRKNVEKILMKERQIDRK